MNKITDLNGNYLEVQYNTGISSGVLYPDKICYTGNADQQFDPQRSVKFIYESRGDIVKKYTAGIKTYYNRRLKYLKTYVGSDQVKEYNLDYSLSSNSTGVSRINSIQEYSPGEETILSLPSTTFGWTNDVNGFATESTWASSVDKKATNKWAVDMNNDGLTDFVYIPEEQRRFYVFLNNGSGAFNDKQFWGLYEYDLADDGINQWMADMNGDGFTDFVYIPDVKDHKKEIRVLLNNCGTGFETDRCWGNRDYEKATYSNLSQWLVDMDNDGLTDYVYNPDNKDYKYQYHILRNTGNNNFAKEKNLGFRNNDNDIGYDGKSQWMKDMNGDGLMDFIYNRNNKKELWVMLNKGGSVFATDSYWGSRDNNVGYSGLSEWMTDMNSDGLTDYVYEAKGSQNYWVMLSFGSGFAKDTQWGNRSHKYNIACDGKAEWMMDMNGDGLPDHVYNPDGTNEYYVMLNIGNNSFGTDTFWGNRGDANKIDCNSSSEWLTDMNGDGLADFVYVPKESTKVSVMLHNGSFPNLLNAITDGLKAQTGINYAPLTDRSVYTRGNGAVFPVKDIQYPMYTVSSYSVSDGINRMNTYSYKYEGAKVHEVYGWLGFASLTIYDRQSGIYSRTSYLQNYPFISIPSSIEQWADAGNPVDPGIVNNHTVIGASSFAFYCENCSPDYRDTTFQPYNGIYQVLKTRETVDHYTYGNKDYTVSTEYEYNNYGNLTLVSDLGDTGITSDDLYTCTGYRNPASRERPWEQMYPTDIKVSSEAASARNFEPAAWNPAKDYSLSRSDYDLAVQPQNNLGVVNGQYRGTMNVIRTSLWDDQNNIYI